MSENTLLAIISQAAKSVKRVRTTLLVAVFGSVFVFICAYNTFSWGWMSSSMEYNSHLYTWCKQKEGDLDKESEKKLPSVEESELYNKFEEDFKKNPRMCTDFLLIAGSVKGKNYLSRKYINIPFSTIVFDVNDLGIFSGVFFCLVMLVLWYNLGLKYTNLYTALNTIEDYVPNGNKKNYFDLLSMSQIISMPDNNNKKKKGFDILVLIPYLLFAFPFITYLIIFINDACTLERVMSMNLMLTIASFTMAGAMLVILLVLVIGCIRLDKKTDHLWDVYEELFVVSDQSQSTPGT